MSRRVHAFNDDALGDLDAVGVAAAVSAGDITAVQAVEAAIARIEQVEGVLNGLVVGDFDRALSQAGRPTADRRDGGTLRGVPTLVKDNTDVFGLPTRHGSLAVPAEPARADAAFTTQLRSTGVVVMGKSTMPEFGFNATTEFEHLPPTRNPWDTDYSSGASSGGAAALVASGAVPLAHANDGGGSIRIPAAACGLVGLKPTRDRVAQAAEAASMPVDIVSNGVVTRSVRDTAAFLAGAEAHRAAPGLPHVGYVEGPSSRRLRVGLLIDSLTGPPDEQTRDAVLSTATLLEELGHEVVEIDLPVVERFKDAFAHYWSLLAFSTQRFGKRLFHPEFDASATDPLTQFLAGRFLRNAWRTPAAVHTLKRSERVYQEKFAAAGIDVALSPVLGHVTPPLGHISPTVPFPEMFERLLTYVSYTPLHNACGAPGMSLPLATSTEGLPIGVHLSALHGDERTLLEAAYELEAARPFARIQD
ncbi:amidase [Aeromicrobium sp. CTD01-1L150]|uniref:amidase n=1 Tax=Aeromicrobium sp. CTD01-1L150 TaxID=3341830 RepID=UPI0035C0BA44